MTTDYYGHASRSGDPFQSNNQPPSSSRPAGGMKRSDTNDSGLDDIYGAYGDSPTKTRTQGSSSSPVRSKMTNAPAAAAAFPPRAESMKRTATDQSTASSTSALDSIPTLDHRNDKAALAKSTGSSSNRAERPSHPSRSKSGNSLDLIDRLDISGLYGGGGFVRHDGPYAAASTNRNQGTRAPIDAFDPSAFSLAPPKPARQYSSNVSPRAAATLAAMDSEGFSNDGPYGAAMGSGSSRRNGDGAGDVSMGFPSKKASGKGQQLIEIYGVRESEAWEDFGSTRYEPESGAASRESIVPPGVNKEDRMQRAQSIWDIEATLRAGKPVGQSAAPPPVPVLPSEWSQSSLSDSSPNGAGSDNKPKRSKSLAARFRAGRKNPNNPILDDQNDQDGREHGVARAADASSPRIATNGSHSQPTSPVDERRMQYPPAIVTHVQGQAISTPMGQSPTSLSAGGAGQIKFDESSAALEKRPSGATRFADDEKKDEGLGRRPSGLKRLFSKKGKN